MKIKSIDEQGQVTLLVSGALDERAERPLAKLGDFRGATKVTFDLQEVEHVNSYGSALWARMMQQIPKTVSLDFINCPASFIEYQTLLGTLIAHGRLISFFAPFQCGACGASAFHVLETARVVAASYHIEPQRCAECGGSCTLEVSEDEYLAVLRRKAG